MPYRLSPALFAGAFLALALHAASAQIVVGQTAGFTGSAAAGVKENTDGARLLIDDVNARGGVYGQRIELISLDDAFDPKTAGANARKLVTERNVVALFLSRGTPHTQAMIPVLDEFRVPLIAPATGAMLLHVPAHPWIFNVRASYQREAQKAVEHLATIGLSRIALWWTDDSFGADSATGARRGFKTSNLEPVVAQTFEREKPDFTKLARESVNAQAQAVVFIGSSAAVSTGTRVLRQAGSKAQVVTLSNNASGGFIKQMDEHAYGTVVTQVFPSERALSVPLIKQAQTLATAKGISDITPAMIEGFAGAKVLVEALRRAGPSPTRQGIKSALETFNRYDIGGLEITYTATDHTGLDYADLSIVDVGGRFRR